MKSVVKNGLGLLIVASLAACSNTESRRQASDDFKYLDTPVLSPWNSLADQQAETSARYEIPRGDFQGELGEGVDIRPPQQLLALLPGLRFQRDDKNVFVWMPSHEMAQQFASTLNKMVKSGDLPVRSKTDYAIDTNWIHWNNAEEVELAKGRINITPQKNAANVGFKIELVDWMAGTDSQGTDPVRLKKDYLTQMTNRLLQHHDQEVRAKARQQALDLVKNIPISLGKDRSGLSVIIARAPFNVMWERLPLTLESMGFSIEDRNRSQGTFEVHYSSPGDDYWSALDILPLDLNVKKFNVQLGDLRNRTSINFTNLKGKPVSEDELSQLSDALKRAIEKTTI